MKCLKTNQLIISPLLEKAWNKESLLLWNEKQDFVYCFIISIVIGIKVSKLARLENKNCLAVNDIGLFEVLAISSPRNSLYQMDIPVARRKLQCTFQWECGIGEPGVLWARTWEDAVEDGGARPPPSLPSEQLVERSWCHDWGPESTFRTNSR